MTAKHATTYHIWASAARSPEMGDTPLELFRVWSISRYDTTTRLFDAYSGDGHITTSFVTGGLTYAEAERRCKELLS